MGRTKIGIPTFRIKLEIPSRAEPCEVLNLFNALITFWSYTGENEKYAILGFISYSSIRK